MHSKLIQSLTACSKTSLSIPKARGIVRLFNSHFKKRKGYPMFVQNKKWKKYKTQVFKDYHRFVGWSYQSEIIVIRKYSTPIAFLRHKCKNVNKLKTSGLSSEEFDYYLELGGRKDVNELFRNSHGKIEDKIREFLREDPKLEAQKPKIIKKKRVFAPMDEDFCHALLLEKQTCAFNEHPHPSFLTFLDWLEENASQTFPTLLDQDDFIDKLFTLQSDEQDWKSFTCKWKLWMIFLDQKVSDVWFEVCLHLSVSNKFFLF